MYKRTNSREELILLQSQGYKLVGWNYPFIGGYILFKAKEL